MEKKNIITAIIGVVIFNVIFWQESLGINMVLFTLLIIGSGVILYDVNWKRPSFMGLAIGTLMASSMIVINNSVISVFATIFGIIGLMAVIKDQSFKTYHTTAITSLINMFNWIPDVIQGISKKETKQVKSWRLLKLVVIPAIVFIVFIALFANANVVFGDFVDNVMNKLEKTFVEFFKFLSVTRILFILFSIYVIGWMIGQLRYKGFLRRELKHTEDLHRVRSQKNFLRDFFMVTTPRKIMGLNNEYLSSKVLILAVGGLVLLINALDIVYVWFGVDYGRSINMSAEVHEGVNILITSIILSIIILLYVFRRNQNFFSKFNSLRNAALFWIIQNGILLISVAIRNSYYIEKQGLTQKRIGVYVFLLIVAFGLLALAIKIIQRKSFFFLSKVNSWFIYGTFVGLSLVNWDNIIYSHNLSHRNSAEIDLSYLVGLSDEVAIKMWKDKDLLRIPYEEHRGSIYQCLTYRIINIKYDLKNPNHTLFSYNMRDERIKNDLKKMGE